jgi:cellulose synthase/poly-beta-1,6-N-acetylglucosamine synthase-like glycosyltransferase
MFWIYLFWLSCFLVFYNYAGYAIIVYILNTFKKKRDVPDNYYPTVSFIVAAYNEEDFIEEKIKNSLAQDYPADKIEYLFITDGSSDGTPDIIRQYPAITLLHEPERRGKSTAVNRAVQFAKHDILIFSDANTHLNKEATRFIARHYKDPKTGGVAGEKKVVSATQGKDQVGDGEGAYWKYESSLKKLDARFYSVVGAAGELFSVRRDLYQPVHASVILDDFVASLEVAQKGYRIEYEPAAYAMELPSFSIKDEQKRKIRIAAGGFQSIGMLAPLLLFWKQPRLSFLYISHRVMRWTTSPLCLITAFLANLVLVITTSSPFYTALFIAQLLFYGVAAITYFVPGKKLPGPLKLPYYFVFMNLSVILGFIRFMRKKQSASWEKAKRAQATLKAQ